MHPVYKNQKEADVQGEEEIRDIESPEKLMEKKIIDDIPDS